MSTPTWQNSEVLAAAAGPQGPQVQAVFEKAADIGLEQSQALRKAAIDVNPRLVGGRPRQTPAVRSAS